MARDAMINACAQISQWFANAVAGRAGTTTAWAQRHVANCPRCRRLLLGHSRLRWALLLLKTQPHRPDLLASANRRAIGVLKRSLRELPKAEKLRHTLPRPSLPARLSKYTQALGHAAACLLVLILMRTSVFSSLKKVDRHSQEFGKAYCDRFMDADLFDNTPSDMFKDWSV